MITKNKINERLSQYKEKKDAIYAKSDKKRKMRLQLKLIGEINKIKFLDQKRKKIWRDALIVLKLKSEEIETMINAIKRENIRYSNKGYKPLKVHEITNQGSEV